MTNVIEQSNNELIHMPNLFSDPAAMSHMMNVATFMSGGTATLPQPYQKNPANCLAVVIQATQWGMSPFSVAQKTFFINGTIGYEAQLVAAVINSSNATKGTFQFEWYGDWTKILGKFKEVTSKTKKDEFDQFKKYKFPNWDLADEAGLGIKVSATLRGENEPRVLDLLLVQANTRNSTLWADDPRQQLAYLAQKRWARLYAPEVIMGVYTPDELDSFEPKEIEINPANQTGAQAAKKAQTVQTVDVEQEKRREELIEQLTEIATKEGLASYAESWMQLTKEDRKLVGTDTHESIKSEAIAFDNAQSAKNVSSTVSDFAAEMEEAEKLNG